MAQSTNISARAVANIVLSKIDVRTDNIGPALNRLLEKTGQRQRATDIVYGTIRNSEAIDNVIAVLADCPVARISRKIRNIVRIGAYELIYSPGTAAHSVVSEAVENAKKITGKKQAGFTNAVLRQIQRHIISREAPLKNANISNTLPQTIDSGCEFDCRILPEAESSESDFLGKAFSLPEWLIESWLGAYGSEKTRQICFASNRKPSIYLRPNRLKIEITGLNELLRDSGVNCEIVDGSMIKLTSPKSISQLPGFQDGFFSVQDMSIRRAVDMLKPRASWKILDLCAAPGGKTTQLAELTNDEAEIVATDIDSRRLEKVKENIQRLAINSVSVVDYGKIEEIIMNSGQFDCVLLDVPCSNSGVLSRRPEVRHRIKTQSVAKSAEIQRQLLHDASGMVKSGGVICYVTCSIQKEENSINIADFLQRRKEFELVGEHLILPSAAEFDHDGSYSAILRKS